MGSFNKLQYDILRQFIGSVLRKYYIFYIFLLNMLSLLVRANVCKNEADFDI